MKIWGFLQNLKEGEGVTLEDTSERHILELIKSDGGYGYKIYVREGLTIYNALTGFDSELSDIIDWFKIAEVWELDWEIYTPRGLSLKEFLFGLKKSTGNAVYAEDERNDYKFFAVRRDDGTLDGYIALEKKKSNGYQCHYFKGDSGVGAENRIIAECQRALGVDLWKLGWRTRYDD